MTTFGVPVFSARYSVWPEKATPASLMVLFCSGAVTMASNQPRRRAFDREVERGQHRAAVGGVQPARHHVGGQRHVDRRESRPGRSAAGRCGAAPCVEIADRRIAGSIRLAVSARKAASPTSTQRASLAQRPGGADRDFRADAGRLADRDRQRGTRACRGHAYFSSRNST